MSPKQTIVPGSLLSLDACPSPRSSARRSPHTWAHAAAPASARAPFRASPHLATRLSPLSTTANSANPTIPTGETKWWSPTTALARDALVLRAADSIGETRDGLPAVSTTTHEPLIRRSVIVGMPGGF